MSDFTSEFKAALPIPVKWTVGDNQYNEAGTHPKVLTLTIPLESAHALANHIMSMAEDQAKHKQVKVWDMKTMSEIETTGITLSAKGKESPYGSIGMLNPAAPKSATLGF